MITFCHILQSIPTVLECICSLLAQNQNESFIDSVNDLLMTPSHFVRCQTLLLNVVLRKTKESDHQGIHHPLNLMHSSFGSLWNRLMFGHSCQLTVINRPKQWGHTPFSMLQFTDLTACKLKNWIVLQHDSPSNIIQRKNTMQEGTLWLCGHNFVLYRVHPQRPLYCSLVMLRSILL